MVGHLVGHNQMMFGLNGGLDIVSKDTCHPRCRRNSPGIGFAQRDLCLVGRIYATLNDPQAIGFLLQMCQLADGTIESFGRDRSTGIVEGLVGTVDFCEICLDGYVDLTKLVTQLLASEALGLDCIEPAVIKRHQVAVQKAEATTQGNERTTGLADCRAIIAPEICDVLEVGRQSTGQRDQFKFAPALALQPPRRMDLIQIAVDVDPKHFCRDDIPVAQSLRAQM